MRSQLKLVHEASKRTHFYSPLIPNNNVAGFERALRGARCRGQQLVRELADGTRDQGDAVRPGAAPMRRGRTYSPATDLLDSSARGGR